MSLTTLALDIALFRNKSGTHPRRKRVAWDELRELLTQHEERREKDGPLWSPTVYAAGATRGKENVQAVTALVLDFDSGVAVGPFRKRWERWTWAAHSTHSHQVDDPHWRGIFPLAAAVPIAEWPTVYRRLAAELGAGQTDPSCKDASRMYFLPSCAPEGPRFAETHEGEALDLSAFPDLAEPEPAPLHLRGGASRSEAGLGSGNYATLDVVAWFTAHDCYGGRLNGERHAVRCPWESEHTEQKPAGERDTDTIVWEADGRRLWPQFCCLHSHCDRRNVRDVMALWGDADRFCSDEFQPQWARAKSSNGHYAAEAAELTLDQAREIATGVCALLKQDVGLIFEPDALMAVALVRRYDPQAWSRLKPLIARAKVSLRELFAQLPAARLAQSDRAEYGGARLDGDDKPQFAGDMLEDCPAPSLAIPHPYFLRWNLTGRMSTDEDGQPKPQTVAFAPVVVTGRMRDAVTGDESLLVSWKWPGSGWTARVVERSQALATRKIMDLANVGFPVGDDSAKVMVAYLHRLEAANRPTLPCAAVSSHLGWQGDPAADTPFLCGRTLILSDGGAEEARALDVERPSEWSEKRVCFHGVGEGEEQIVEAFHCRGDLDGWRRAVSALRQHPKALVPFYASFTAPLLAVFNVPNFIVDLSNRTSTGKTTALRAAASVWGNPDERTASSVVGTWDATRVWTERASHVMSGLPLIMDDTKKAKHPRMVAELIYAVTSGRGRGRGTISGIAQTAAWRTVLLSSGEQPATSFTQDGGTRTRVLGIRGIPFGSADVATGKTVSKLNAQLCQHYGHAGVLFMQWLQKNRDTWGEWQARYLGLVEQYSEQPPVPEAGRLAQYAALIQVAGEMAHRAVGLPWEFRDPLAMLWNDLAREAADAAGDIRALEHVVSWAYSHEQSFIGRFPKQAFDERTPPAVSGRWDEEEWDALCFYPNVLRGILKGEGYEYESILSGWREREWLLHDTGKFTRDVWVGNGKTPKMVSIVKKAIDSLGKDA